MFESSVISYGSKTHFITLPLSIAFESSVFHIVEKIRFEEWIKTGRPLN